MVKRSRMTKKKSVKKFTPKKTTKSTKVKKGLAKRSVRGSAKTDRANQATNKLLKSLTKKRGSR